MVHIKKKKSSFPKVLQKLGSIWAAVLQSIKMFEGKHQYVGKLRRGVPGPHNSLYMPQLNPVHYTAMKRGPVMEAVFCQSWTSMMEFRKWKWFVTSERLHDHRALAWCQYPSHPSVLLFKKIQVEGLPSPGHATAVPGMPSLEESMLSLVSSAP